MWLWVLGGRPTHKIPQIQFGIRGQRRGERLNISFISTTHKHTRMRTHHKYPRNRPPPPLPHIKPQISRAGLIEDHLPKVNPPMPYSPRMPGNDLAWVLMSTTAPGKTACSFFFFFFIVKLTKQPWHSSGPLNVKYSVKISINLLLPSLLLPVREWGGEGESVMEETLQCSESQCPRTLTRDRLGAPAAWQTSDWWKEWRIDEGRSREKECEEKTEGKWTLSLIVYSKCKMIFYPYRHNNVYNLFTFKNNNKWNGCFKITVRY